MNFINFIIENILTQAAITIGLVALLGFLVLQKNHGASFIRNI